MTKLIRNLGLAFAIPALSYVHAASNDNTKDLKHKEESENKNPDKKQKRESETMSGLMTFTKKYVPPFLFAFLGMSTLRSCGDMVLAETAVQAAYFEPTMNFIGNDLSKYLLGTAMSAVGLSTAASSLQGVGWRPFAVGGAGALVVGFSGLAVASMMV